MSLKGMKLKSGGFAKRWQVLAFRSLGRPVRMMRRQLVLGQIIVLGVLWALGGGAAPTRPVAISVSQFAKHPVLDTVLRGFMDALHDQHLTVKYQVHLANGDMAANTRIAKQILREQPDLVLAISTPSAQACVTQITDRPVVFAAITDPIQAGLVTSLEKPGGNATGTSDKTPVAKTIGLIKDLQPDIRTLGTVFNPAESNSRVMIQDAHLAADGLGIRLVEAHVASADKVPMAAIGLVGQCQAIYIPSDNTVTSVFNEVAMVCHTHGLPLYSSGSNTVPQGAIFALAINYYKLGHQTGQMAGRILAGAKPASMPVEVLEELMIYLNISAAEHAGVEIPVELAMSADAIYSSFDYVHQPD